MLLGDKHRDKIILPPSLSFL